MTENQDVITNILPLDTETCDRRIVNSTILSHLWKTRFPIMVDHDGQGVCHTIKAYTPEIKYTWSKRNFQEEKGKFAETDSIIGVLTVTTETAELLSIGTHVARAELDIIDGHTTDQRKMVIDAAYIMRINIIASSEDPWKGLI